MREIYYVCSYDELEGIVMLARKRNGLQSESKSSPLGKSFVFD